MKDWVGLNILPNHANFVGAMELGCGKSLNFSFNFFKKLYIFQKYYIQFYKKLNPLLINLNNYSLDNINFTYLKPFIFYGFFTSRMVKFFKHIFPIKTYLEKKTSYINLENKIQKSNPIISSLFSD